jgi:hypothetical protein
VSQTQLTTCAPTPLQRVCQIGAHVPDAELPSANLSIPRPQQQGIAMDPLVAVHVQTIALPLVPILSIPVEHSIDDIANVAAPRIPDAS